MSTEIQTLTNPGTDMQRPVGTVESYAAGASALREYAELMATAKSLAEQICRTSMVPDHFKGKPDECAAAMLYGASLGLNPMQAVKAVYVVYGNAALYARGMDAIVKAAGHETWTVEAGPEKVVMAGRRRGSNKIETAEWTIDRAIQAGYVPTIDPSTGKYAVNKNGKLIGNEKYLTDPETMLRAKATAEICRTIAPDVLNGVYSAEEREMDYIEAEVVEVKRTPAPSKGLAAAMSTSTGDQPQQPAGAEPSITRAQVTAMGQLMKQVGVGDDKAAGLAFVADVIGRQIERREDLTAVEAQQVIDALQGELDARES
jgi:hypothetical protein